MSDAADETTSLLQTAQAQFRDRNYHEAISSFKKVLESQPGNVKAIRGLAAAYAQSGELDLAIEQYQALTRTDLTNGIAWLNLGSLYNLQERYQEATKAIRTGLMKEKKSAIGYYQLGEAHLGLKQNSMAMTAFKEAVKLAPDMIDAHISIGKLYLEMKSHKQAIRHFEDALKIKPDSKRVAAALRDARQEKDDERDALNPFGRLVDMDNMGLKNNVIMNRELTEEEQLHDRQMVRSLATDLMIETSKCLNKIREEVEPALLTISRTLAEGGASPNNVLSSVSKLQEAIHTLNEQRKQMRQKVMFIRGHEEVVNTPEFGGQLGMRLDIMSRPKILDDQLETDD